MDKTGRIVVVVGVVDPAKVEFSGEDTFFKLKFVAGGLNNLLKKTMLLFSRWVWSSLRERP